MNTNNTRFYSVILVSILIFGGLSCNYDVRKGMIYFAKVAGDMVSVRMVLTNEKPFQVLLYNDSRIAYQTESTSISSTYHFIEIVFENRNGMLYIGNSETGLQVNNLDKLVECKGIEIGQNTIRRIHINSITPYVLQFKTNMLGES